MYAPTPNRLTRQAGSENKSSSTSDDEGNNFIGNTRSKNDEVAVYCRLRPLSLEENEV